MPSLAEGGGGGSGRRPETEGAAIPSAFEVVHIWRDGRADEGDSLEDLGGVSGFAVNVESYSVSTSTTAG